MKVRTIRTISQGSYIVSIRTEDFSEEELRWISEYGEPEISTGGTFEVIGETDDEVSLPDSYSKVLTGFKAPGVSMSFDPDTYVDAKAVALAWQVLITDRILEAMVDLKAGVDGNFRGESVSQPTYP